MIYVEKWEQEKYDKLMAEKGFKEFAEQEFAERCKIGVNCSKDMKTDIIMTFGMGHNDEYADGWYWHKVAEKLNNNDKKTIDTMNKVFEDMGKMSTDEILAMGI